MNSENLIDVETYCLDNKENIYYIDLISVQHGKLKALQLLNIPSTNYVFMGGWLCQSPILTTKLNDLGISNPRDAIVDKENLYVIFEKTEDPQDYFWNSMSDFYTYDVKIQDTFSTRTGKEFVVYKLERIKN